tara:strand:- start:3712 stop:3969 length:258 start_codon:yes stop_codon:yes gene_type:complete
MSQKKNVIDDKIIRSRILHYCRLKKIRYEILRPILKYNRSIIQQKNCFMILNLMILEGAEIGFDEYRQWRKELETLFENGFKLVL